MLFEDAKYLWLMLMAVVPLIIHFINRGDKSIVNIGSLEWLKEKNYQQRSYLKFQQFWLWLVRTLIFLLIAFIVAKPYFSNNEKVKNKHLLLVKPDVSNKILNEVFDTLSTDKWNVQWLNWGLETIDLEQKNISNSNSIHPYEAFQLIEYNGIMPMSATVLGYFNEHQLKFETPKINFKVDWILLPSKNKNITTDLALKKMQGKNEVLEIEQKEYLTKVIANKKQSENLLSVDFSLETIVVAYNNSNKQIANLVEAALKAITTYQQISVEIIKVTSKKVDKNISGDALFLMDDDFNDKVVLNQFKKIYQYNSRILKNNFINKNDKYVYFNLDKNEINIPDLLNEMLFKNEAVDKKYNALADLPVSNTFGNSFNKQTNASGFISIKKSIGLIQFLVPMLLLLILMERVLCRLTN